MAQRTRDPAVDQRMGAWRDLTRVNAAVRAAVNRAVQEQTGLTLPESLLLCEVAHSPWKRLRMAELAASLNVAKSAVTKTVDRLEDRGLLARERGGDDRRTISATLTHDGHDAFTSTMPILVAAVAARFAVLTDDETRQLRSLLAKLAGAAGDDAAD